ncbi:MAG TPA: DNA alkylation repair protein [Kiritimatiellia bacterium]|nr:DNA alkylation repair protein [Kiritimatiellia bacterium]HMO99812.1 DNA alkylation repair protein [Kiritimatiellia bacterium]
MNQESAEKRKAFKEYFDAEAAARLADQFGAAWPSFDAKAFCLQATTGLDTLEFNARVKQFSDALAATLPRDRKRALAILTRSLPPVLPDTEAITDGWLQWPLGQFIADHGLPHLEESMEAMIALTMRFSSEFAVRPFIDAYPEHIYPRLYTLTRHPNLHVRRWCSEGSRPRLPWGKKLTAIINDPSPSWPILEALMDDPELYVRKSVANHLNDIAKDHSDKVITACRRWKKQATPERQWVIRHGLRSLIKAGNPHALALLGFANGSGLTAKLNVQPRTISIGKSITLEAEVTNQTKAPCRALIDYVIHFARPSGKPSSKVFKWTQVEVPARNRLAIVKKHQLRHASIRTLYPGRHRAELQVNGQRLAQAEWMLNEADA